MEIVVRKTYEVTNEDLVNILSVFDCHGWCCTINYDKSEYIAARAKVCNNAAYEDVLVQILLNGGTLEFVDAEEPRSRYELTLGMLYEGIAKAIEDEYFSDYNWYGDGELNTCQIDSEVADVIVQCALFGEAVYG